MASWQGTDYNEKLINSVKNGLVGIYLDGVKGVSTPVSGEEHRLISPEDADRYIAKARVVYAKLVDQKPLRSVKAWHDRHVKALDGLITKAVAVREGRTPQKQTAASYGELRRSLGLR